MKNALTFFLFLFSLNCFAQDSTNPIDFKFQDDYIFSAPSLYLMCVNDIYFSISDDTNLDKLSYKVKGGKLIIKDSLKFVSLIPTSAKITLEIFYDGKMITEQDFRVKLIPKPIIKVEELSDKVLTFLPKKLNVNISADETFKNDLPNEANYNIKEYKVSLVMGNKLMAEKIFKQNEGFTKKEIKKYTKLIKAEPKEDWRLVVVVSEIQRINYKNESEKVQVGHWGQGEVFTLPIKIN